MDYPVEDKNRERPKKRNRTGEDIDMLHEDEYEPQSNDYSGSYKYKDHIDGA